SNPISHLPAYVFGYLPLVLTPILVSMAPRPSPVACQRFEKCLIIVIGFMALAALTQGIFGWERVGLHFQAGDTRARAFYSHPLTLAYVGLLVFPFALAQVARQWRNPWFLTLMASEIIIIWTSRSRVVQLVVVMMCAFHFLYSLSGRRRVFAIA